MAKGRVDIWETEASLWMPDEDTDFWTYLPSDTHPLLIHYHAGKGNRAGWMDVKCVHRDESDCPLIGQVGDKLEGTLYRPSFQIRDMLEKFRNATPKEREGWGMWQFSEARPDISALSPSP